MTIDLYTDLLSRKNFMIDQLHALPENAKMTKIVLQRDLSAIEKKLSELISQRDEKKVRVSITFSGSPVDGSRGIWAEFASKAVTGFTESINTLINGDGKSKLYIKDIAVGSFGFILEEYVDSEVKEYAVQKSLFVEEVEKTSEIQIAINQLISFFKSATENDDVLSENLQDINDKALERIRKFIDILKENEALCSIKLPDRKFSFNNKEEIINISDSLSEGNIHTKDEYLDGMFVGCLPIGRTSEFRIKDTQNIIKVKIPKSIIDIDLINQNLYKQVTIQVSAKYIRNAKEQYALKVQPKF